MPDAFADLTDDKVGPLDDLRKPDVPRFGEPETPPLHEVDVVFYDRKKRRSESTRLRVWDLDAACIVALGQVRNERNLTAVIAQVLERSLVDDDGLPDTYRAPSDADVVDALRRVAVAEKADGEASDLDSVLAEALGGPYDHERAQDDDEYADQAYRAAHAHLVDPRWDDFDAWSSRRRFFALLGDGNRSMSASVLRDLGSWLVERSTGFPTQTPSSSQQKGKRGGRGSSGGRR